MSRSEKFILGHYIRNNSIFLLLLLSILNEKKPKKLKNSFVLVYLFQ